VRGSDSNWHQDDEHSGAVAEAPVADGAVADVAAVAAAVATRKTLRS
jgi:hypothetical protein